MDGDTLGRLIYLLLLGLIVGGWFFAQNRKNLNRTLQQAILWLFLFVGMIILYGLKDDLRLQMSPRASVQMQGEQVRLVRERDRHFYATLLINGVEVMFVVDTGATDMVLTPMDARRVGINLDTLIYTGRASTANGEVRTARVKLKDVRLGEFSDKNISAWVNDGEMDMSLLGMAYLSRYSKLEISGDTMLLTR